jgi:hypothetical protein
MRHARNPEEYAIAKFRRLIAQRAGHWRHLRKLRDQVLKHYGDKCSCPGCDEWRREFLCIDHIDGGGHVERKRIGGSSSFYRWIIKQDFPQHLRLLCHNCNMALGAYGYCPHQERQPGEDPPF